MTRLALIGLGAIAQSVHLPLLQRNRADIDVVAVAELSPTRRDSIAARYGVGYRFATVADLVDAVRGGLRLDAAILATGGTHAADALELIAAGIRVLSEKPLAYSHRELDDLSAGLSALGRDPRDWLRVGYMKEYDPAVAAARVALEGKRVREVGVEVLHPADAAQLAFARIEPPAADVSDGALTAATSLLDDSLAAALGPVPEPARRLYASVVLGSIVHDLALTRHLGLGPAHFEHARRWGDGFPGSITADGATADGAPWRLGWHFIADYPEYRERVTVHHDRGTVELEFRTPYILNAPTVLREHAPDEGLGHRVQERSWPQEEGFERELRALAALTDTQDPPGSCLAEARADLVAAQALWNALADSAGIAPGPGSEAAAQRGSATGTQGKERR